MFPDKKASKRFSMSSSLTLNPKVSSRVSVIIGRRPILTFGDKRMHLIHAYRELVFPLWVGQLP